MEVKSVEVMNNYVAMTFVPRKYNDIVMAETIFGNIVAEQYGQEIFEPFPDGKSSFIENEITRMVSSEETKFYYDDEKGVLMTTSNRGSEELKRPFHNDDPFKQLEDFHLIDKFWVKCVQPEDDIKCSYGWIDVLYQIRLGEHTLESNISEWSTDWNQIRHDLEHLIWHGETEIDLNFEDSPTRLILHKINAMDSTVEIHGGLCFNWEPLIKIEVIPNEFEKEIKPFYGYGKQLDVFKAIYYGLQGLADAYPEENEENSEMTRENVSKKLHSSMIDEYIEILERDISDRTRRKVFQLNSLRKENEKKALDSLSRMIREHDTQAQVDYLTNCDIDKAKALYSAWAKLYVDETWGIVLPDPKDEYIDSVATNTTALFFKELENGLSVEDAHKKACWDLNCALDHYRIKL